MTCRPRPIQPSMAAGRTAVIVFPSPVAISAQQPRDIANAPMICSTCKVSPTWRRMASQATAYASPSDSPVVPTHSTDALHSSTTASNAASLSFECAAARPAIRSASRRSLAGARRRSARAASRSAMASAPRVGVVRTNGRASDAQRRSSTRCLSAPGTEMLPDSRLIGAASRPDTGCLCGRAARRAARGTGRTAPAHAHPAGRSKQDCQCFRRPRSR